MRWHTIHNRWATSLAMTVLLYIVKTGGHHTTITTPATRTRQRTILPLLWATVCKYSTIHRYVYMYRIYKWSFYSVEFIFQRRNDVKYFCAANRNGLFVFKLWNYWVPYSIQNLPQCCRKTSQMVALYDTGMCPPAWSLLRYDSRYIYDDSYAVPMYYWWTGWWSYRVCFRAPTVRYTYSSGDYWPTMATCCYQVFVLPFWGFCGFPYWIGWGFYYYPYYCMRSSWIFYGMYGCN